MSYKDLEKKLLKQRVSPWDLWSDKTKKDVFSFAEEYKNFLNQSKTERETVREGVKILEKNGFKDISKFKTLKKGDKLYWVNREKALLFVRMGEDLAKDGFHLLMSHIDSPHLDLKISPLYEDEFLAFFKTHYYGGIKKYQWPTIALALHGVVFLKNGQRKEIVVGEDEKDPVFMITDLLPHLDRPGGPGTTPKKREVAGEDLNLLIGSLPVKDKKIKERVKLAILEILHKKYKIKEDDFDSAELQAVPSEKARDLGFDRSLISAYGHDDKICSYALLRAILDAKTSKQTMIGAWVDREEIGSDGNTGAQSVFFDSFVSLLLKKSKKEYGMREVYELYSRSRAISADVSAGVDPDYKEVHDLRNAHRIGFGAVIERYTGSGGKYSSSEASAEFMAYLKNIFSKDKNIIYQSGGGLGKVDQGGGGTIAKYMANRNIDIVDIGVALFNMHAPLEIASKLDLYSVYLLYKKFFENF